MNNTTLQRLEIHLSVLTKQLLWAEYAFSKTPCTNHVLLTWQNERIKDIRAQVKGTEYAIASVKNAIDVAEVIGFPTHRDGDRLVIDFPNVIKG